MDNQKVRCLMNKKPGSVYSLITRSIHMEYAVVIREHPDNPNLLLMCPISHSKTSGYKDLRLRDDLWRRDQEMWTAHEAFPTQHRLREKLLEKLLNPEDDWVVAHCGHTFWIEADKLTNQEENMEKYELRMIALYEGNLSENNLRWLRSVIRKLVTGQCIDHDQNWDGCFVWNIEYLECDSYDNHMRCLERAIRRIEAK